MVRCMIVDDEPLAQQVLKKYIEQTDGLTLSAECFHAAAAFAVLHQQPIDLLFLDIKMPQLTGTQFIQSLKEPPAFIFTTAYPDFALLGFELEAVDYLLKPITYDRFKKSIARFLNQQPIPPSLPEKDYVYFKVNGSLVKVVLAEILFAQSMKDYIRIITTTGQHITHLTMKSLLQLLPEQQFKRVHRSYVVNIRHIDRLSKEAVTIGQTTIPLGEHYKMNLKML
ncbi:DNA-binding response regulator [Paraflavitalea soli]|uniref:DNA-binding response regulator n=1 Tax=Paraflavitalea soli TaxID=2315862 RepID=A0A3B7MHT2_9BACT|nr:LytTR family DNA-binding domain-containing protein [Paraflavitalea soli]AXY72863.1 DNA-binding response regulator [Paraflavitalea soli]